LGDAEIRREGQPGGCAERRAERKKMKKRAGFMMQIIPKETPWAIAHHEE